MRYIYFTIQNKLSTAIISTSVSYFYFFPFILYFIFTKCIIFVCLYVYTKYFIIIYIIYEYIICITDTNIKTSDENKFYIADTTDLTYFIYLYILTVICEFRNKSSVKDVLKCCDFYYFN